MKLSNRKTVVIDKRVQGMLAFRIARYWMLSLLAIFILLTAIPLLVTWCLDFSNVLTTGQLFARAWSMFWPAMGASLFLLPAVIVDLLRLSNRFVGPVYRLRNRMRDLADGKAVDPVILRKDDFWHDFAVEFNRVAARFRELPQTGNGNVVNSTDNDTAESSLTADLAKV